MCGVSLGVQNRFDGLRQIDRLGQDWPEASHDDADDDAAPALIYFCNMQRKAEQRPCEPSKNCLSEIGEH